MTTRTELSRRPAADAAHPAVPQTFAPTAPADQFYHPPAAPDPTAIRAEDFVPKEYLLRHHTTRCTSCDRISTWDEVFLVYVHPQWTASTKFRRLLPVTSLALPLPIGLTTTQPRNIPCCAFCLPDISAARQAAARPPITDREWADALAHEAQLALRRAAPAKASKPEIDIDDLPL